MVHMVPYGQTLFIKAEPLLQDIITMSLCRFWHMNSEVQVRIYTITMSICRLWPTHPNSYTYMALCMLSGVIESGPNHPRLPSYKVNQRFKAKNPGSLPLIPKQDRCIDRQDMWYTLTLFESRNHTLILICRGIDGVFNIL